MKTEKEISNKIEEVKEDTMNVGKCNDVGQLAFVQGYVEALRWVLK